MLIFHIVRTTQRDVFNRLDKQYGPIKVDEKEDPEDRFEFRYFKRMMEEVPTR
jgi:hypothetical protein